MDPICHTLFGAALGSTGLERKTRFGRMTLIVGANLPDLDVIAYGWGETAALGMRRGITHGIPALLILPLMLAGVMMWFGRRPKSGKPRPATDFNWLLGLAAISIASHPALDFLNVYGVRWLMPFDDTWFYGDTLYIVDPWMWSVLATSLLLARLFRSRQPLPLFARPAILGLLVAISYIGAMAVGSSLSRRVVESEFSDAEIPRFMVAPFPVNPFRRSVVIDGKTAYRFGTVELWPRPHFQLEDRLVSKGQGAASDRASATPEGQIFLSWARFPFFEPDEPDDPSAVYILDARYTLSRDATFGAVRIPLPAAETEAPARSGAAARGRSTERSRSSEYPAVRW
jgi:inner membrane protein